MKTIRLLSLLLIITRGSAWAGDAGIGSVMPNAELRLRGERRSNNDFNARAYDLQHYGAMRARAGILAVPARKTELFLQAQYTNYFGGLPLKADDPTFRTTLSGGSVPATGVFELHQGYLLFKDVFKSGAGVKAGRQELNYGDQRLIGAFDYSMLARRFDALKLQYGNAGTLAVDLFAARASMGPVTKTTAVTKSIANDPDKGRDVYGAYLRTTRVPGFTIDAYEFLLRDGFRQRFGAEDPAAPPDKAVIYTTGSRVQFTGLKGLEVTGEAALQGGQRYNVPHRAHAWALKGYYRFPVKFTPGAGAEALFATGDGKPKDGESNEFENLFPTNHAKYGALDLFGWRNIRAQHVTLGLEPRKNLGIFLDGWRFQIPEPGGAWKNAGGGVVFKRAAAGAVVTHDAGSELDLTIKYTLFEKVAFLGHYGKFLPGELVRNQPGRHATPEFVMLQVQTSL